MADNLRNDELSACVHRVALSRGEPFSFVAPPLPEEVLRRRRGALEHRASVLEEIATAHPDAATSSGPSRTLELMREGRELILSARTLRDDDARRSAAVHALVRTGRHDERFTYAPLLIKQHEVVEHASTRRTLEGSLSRPRPSEATFVDGLGVRANPPMTRSGLALSHATRVLASLGHVDPGARGAVVDRQRRLWWFTLSDGAYPRFNLASYDRYFDERRAVLDAHDEWRAGRSPFPTAPYWHRDCDQCPYAAHCETELEARDDVSLVRFTNAAQQTLLREHGVATRAALARLDPTLARGARRRPAVAPGEHPVEVVVGRGVDKLEDLIYRARAHERGASMRVLDAVEVGCPGGDVEVDVDMESCDDGTYLWGALVTTRRPLDGVTEGYHEFVEWSPLTPAREAANFARFWRWLDELRRACATADRTFVAYCFWAQAEDGAMNRAVAAGDPAGPDQAALSSFRRAEPSAWIDVHELVQRQIQTEGPLGLKQLAGAAGFSWRDPTPGGEASIVWYETATRDDSDEARRSRRRVLEYNEDDCRATRALRDWLNGPAKSLAHRDDPL